MSSNSNLVRSLNAAARKSKNKQQPSAEAKRLLAISNLRRQGVRTR
jgi:hypothetical protein